MTFNGEQRKKFFLWLAPPALLGLVSVVLGKYEHPYLSALFFLFFVAWVTGMDIVMKRKLDKLNNKEKQSS